MEINSGRKNVLLVEDDLTLGELTSLILEKHGYTVTWFVRARFAEGQAGDLNSLVLMNDRGVETALADLLAAGSDEYLFALVDSRLKGSALQGIDVTRALCQARIKTVACSGLPWLNQDMVKAGAAASIEKHDIYTVLKIGDDFLQALQAFKDKKKKK